MNLKSIPKFISDAIAARKAAKLARVVDAYIALARTRCDRLVPVIFDMYRDAAHAVIEETERDPKPLYALITALEGAAVHYGPRLKMVFAHTNAELQRAQQGIDSNEFTQSVRALTEEECVA